MGELYYTPPEKDIFEEVKAKCIELWRIRYPHEYDRRYVEGKTSYILSVQNIEDNMLSLISMFDTDNRTLLAEMLSEKARREIRDRLLEVGWGMKDIPF